VLQCDAGVWQCVTVRGRVWQCCSVMQVCCSVLQYVAVCEVKGAGLLARLQLSFVVLFCRSLFMYIGLFCNLKHTNENTSKRDPIKETHKRDL